MELLYLWIDNFREIFSEIEFNFSKTNNYSYDKKLGVIKIAENQESLPSNFFWGISSLSAIVGENGIGKSSLLDFIKRNLANCRAGSLTANDDGNFIAIFTNCIINKGLLIENIKELNKPLVSWDDMTNRHKYFGNNIFTYFSNVFDYQDDHSDQSNLMSVSTNHLILEDSYRMNGIDYIGRFVNKEIERQINFISKKRMTMPFNLPEKIYLSVSNIVFQYKHEILNNELAIDFGNIIFYNDDDEIIEKIKKQIFLNFLKLTSYKNGINYQIIENKLLQFYFSQFNIIELGEINDFELKSMVEKISLFFNHLNYLLDSGELFAEKDDDKTFTYLIKESNERLYQLLGVYSEIVGVDSFIYPYWRNMSSGEKALLNFFSRLQFAKEKINAYSADYEDFKYIILLLDETELYLHPNWQRKQITFLVDIIPKIFNEYETIQIILTSHSPFIISDLPKENIIFLEKDRESKKVIVSKLSEHENTFGANIHTLLTDSFFMREGLIGEFAKVKIQDLIDFLNDKSSLIEKKEDALKIIELIGEPIIKNQLMDMWNEKFQGQTLEDLKNIIKELKEENEKLKNDTN